MRLLCTRDSGLCASVTSLKLASGGRALFLIAVSAVPTVSHDSSGFQNAVPGRVPRSTLRKPLLPGLEVVRLLQDVPAISRCNPPLNAPGRLQQDRREEDLKLNSCGVTNGAMALP